MSKPRYRWWGYVKSMIRNYPAVQDKYCQGNILKERQAVQKAIELTEKMTNGTERMQVVDMVFFSRSHTLAGAALMVPCSYATAKRWIQRFIELVAKNYGLMDES